MKKAETYITKDNISYTLPNDLIIAYLLSHNFIFSEKIATNLYFQWQLFNMFDVLNSSEILDITVNDEKIVISNCMGDFEITINSDGGLTLVNDECRSGDVDLSSKERTIYEIFPDEHGIIFLIRHQSAVGNIVSFDCLLENDLTVEYIAEDGLLDKKVTFKQSKMQKKCVFSYEPSIVPLRKEEYLQVIKKHYSNKDETVHEEMRDATDVCKVLRKIKYPNPYKKYQRTHVYNEKDLLGIVNFESIDACHEGHKDNGLRSQILNFTSDDEICCKLITSIIKRKKYNISLPEKLKISSNKKKIVEVLLSKNKVKCL